MFREMRRRRQMLSTEECLRILAQATSGVLALRGNGEYPYAVPMSFVYCAGKLYFHSALSGHKIDAIRTSDKVSFLCVEQDSVVPEQYTTYFRSVIAFGRCRIIEGIEEKRQSIEWLAAKYSPHLEEGRIREIEKGFNAMCMIELDIEHMTGKEAIELARARKRP